MAEERLHQIKHSYSELDRPLSPAHEDKGSDRVQLIANAIGTETTISIARSEACRRSTPLSTSYEARGTKKACQAYCFPAFAIPLAATGAPPVSVVRPLKPTSMAVFLSKSTSWPLAMMFE